MACSLKFNDDKKIGCENYDYKNNALICYEVETGNLSITRGVDIGDLCAVQYESVDKIVACFNLEHVKEVGQLTTDGKVFGTCQQRYWRSPLSDLGYSNKEKCIREISLHSSYDAVVTVFTENESRSFNIIGSNVLAKFPVRIKGKQVGIKIESNTEKAYINNVKLTVDLVDSEYV